MAAAAGYRILDEPRPGALAQYAVNPTWPFLALMLAGGWLAWPWFVFNAIALGSSNRSREILWVVGGLLGTLVVLGGLIATSALFGATVEPAIPYLRILPIVWKLLVGYVVFGSQQRSFQLFEWFGGAPKNGMFALIAGVVLKAKLLTTLLAMAGGESSLAANLLLRVLE
jgi:hypothetical protein